MTNNNYLLARTLLYNPGNHQEHGQLEEFLLLRYGDDPRRYFGLVLLDSHGRLLDVEAGWPQMDVKQAAISAALSRADVIVPFQRDPKASVLRPSHCKHHGELARGLKSIAEVPLFVLVGASGTIVSSADSLEE